MKWFKHDADANMDAKLQEIMLDYGLEGYGLYWYCIELIAQRVNADNLTFELEHDCRIIARNTGSTPQKVEQMMKDFVRLGLLNANNGHVFCLKLATRCDDFTQKIVRKQQKPVKNQSVGVSPSLSEKVPLDKIRLDKNIKHLSVVTDGFDHWWNLYPSSRRVNKKGCLIKFKSKCKNLSDEEIINFVNLISDDIDKKLKQLDDVKFMTTTTTYLNQERYNDES